MKITHYLYNTFVIESGDKKIAIDPGAEIYVPRLFKTILPKSEWESITHIFVTHGDPDHHWNTDRVAESSHASVICNTTMVESIEGKTLMLGPRDRGIAFTTPVEKLHTISANETIEVDGMSITGIKATHGPVTFKLGPFSQTLHPGSKERVGWGAIGFNIQFDGMTIVNLGDTILHKEEWQAIENPDVLMIPIGGRIIANTMDEAEALQAMKVMKPKRVIPCHYNCPALFDKCYNPANDNLFKRKAEKMGVTCALLYAGDSIEL